MFQIDGVKTSAVSTGIRNLNLDDGGYRMKLWSNGSIETSLGGFNPERRLLAAVLQRAITDYLTGEGELQESARDWLYSSDDPNESFGFAYICEALDFHKEELRKAIRSQYEDQVRLISTNDMDEAASNVAA